MGLLAARQTIRGGGKPLTGIRPRRIKGFERADKLSQFLSTVLPMITTVQFGTDYCDSPAGPGSPSLLAADSRAGVAGRVADDRKSQAIAKEDPMKRALSSWAALVLAAALSGCSICQSPFDYCGPVEGPDGHPNCDFGARRGSLYTPMDDSASGAQLEPTLAERSPDTAEEAADVAYEAPAPRGPRQARFEW